MRTLSFSVNELINSPLWYNALTLAERVEIYSKVKSEKLRLDFEVDTRIFSRWKDVQEKYELSSEFAEILNLIGEESLIEVLSLPSQFFMKNILEQPEWLSTIAEAYSRQDDSTKNVNQFIQEISTEAPLTIFCYILAPLLVEPLKTIEKKIISKEIREAPIAVTEQYLNIFLRGFILELTPIISRTMILEVNIARLEEKLNRETPEERFLEYADKLREQDFALQILRNYPVLARKVLRKIKLIEQFYLKFIDELYEDWSEICDEFGLSKNNVIVRLEKAGDSHRNGQSVQIVYFHTGQKVVYKPRSLSIDRSFQAVIKWNNNQSDLIDLKLFKLLDKSTHGWVEFISSSACKDDTEVRSFYKRIGSLLCILYFLNANDFHYENIIACGQYPVPIDLETLLQPKFDDNTTIDSWFFSRLNDTPQLNYTVFQTGLLPNPTIDDVNQEVRGNVSGLGAIPGQPFPFLVSTFENLGSDSLRIVEKSVNLDAEDHLPKIGSSIPNISNYISEITESFTLVYLKIINNLDDFTGENGLISTFKEVETRYIVTPTLVYLRYAYDANHPALLGNALEQEIFWDSWGRFYKNRQGFVQQRTDELAQLKDLDVPIFFSRPTSHDLMSSTGKIFFNVMNKTGYDNVSSKLENASKSDLERQKWCIEASLLISDMTKKSDQRPNQKPDKKQEFSAQRCLKIAENIAHKLEKLAYVDGDEIFWVNIGELGDELFGIIPSSIYLYDGLTGIGLFFAYLSYISPDPNFRLIHEKILKSVMSKAQKAIIDQDTFNSSLPIGAYAGVGSIIYYLTCVAVLTSREELYDFVEALLARISPLVEYDDNYDVMSGSSGLIIVLVKYYQITTSGKALQLAIQCAQHLMESAEEMERGVGWSFRGGLPLTGFAHGSAGIAYSLALLSEVTSNGSYLDFAQKAFEYERSTFSPIAMNWPDLRGKRKEQKTLENGFSYYWCHGSAGIALSRAKLINCWDSDEVYNELMLAVYATVSHGFPPNHSLCHGAMGNLDILITSAHLFDDTNLLDKIQNLKRSIVDRIDSDGWRCPTPSNVDTCGLMIGIAGIGYQLLRLAYPKIVPSVLALEVNSSNP